MQYKVNYYLGLDIGTDSVGYAVTDERYKLLKFKGEPMWGSHLFDPANQAAERRGFRTARRRLDRRQLRVQLVDEILCPEVVKVDPDFYIRKKESALYGEDKSAKGNYLFFNMEDYTDKDYYREYPTIHHLIVALMTEKEKKFDIRLINMALDWLVAHRGHFLIDVGMDNVEKVIDFSEIYDRFLEFFDEEDSYRCRPWDRINTEELGAVLKLKGINKKKLKLKELLYGNGFPTDEYFLDRKEFINWLSGGKVQLNKLFTESEYEDDLKASISDDMEILLPQLTEEDAELISRTSAMYDWSVLSDILSGKKYISEAKVEVYECHKNDLSHLKGFVRKYAKEKYAEVFRKSGKNLKNYVAYVYNADSHGTEVPEKKASREDFYAFLKKTLSLDKIACDCKEDEAFLQDMLARMETGRFLPKQITTDNRVIPYQLYYAEYKKILENSSAHYDFLLQKDADGYSNIEKLEKIFTFKIPYYVGPLRHDNDDDKYAWIVRKANGKIRPWNFEDKVDLDKSEEEFIRRMTNSCTYIPGQSVLPKWSLLYTKYTVLNEINNLKVNGVDIDVETKQGIYNELFRRRSKVTPKMIKEYLISTGKMKKDDTISGVDETIKSSLKPEIEFRHLMEKNILSREDVEKIISRKTYSEDNRRFKVWLAAEYPTLSEDDFKYLSKLKYKEFGRLSEFFLTKLVGTDKETGETGTIMHFLWESNDNLMQLLSDRYSFVEEISRLRQEYYSEHKLTFDEQLDELGISNAVKRPVTRTFAVVEDVVSAMGYPPKKIFVEMARGAEETKKRTVTRKDQILELYKSLKEDTRELEKMLEDMGDTANNRLQSESLFLYFTQLGKCMYSGEPIDISQIKSTKYNVDHIWPQSFVKDDSLLNNKVLVLSKINGDKSDNYPIDSSIRKKMQPMWKKLLDNGLITKEKYERLIRNTPFTDKEKEGFISRQLVETRQSMKAVTQLLNNKYPESKVIYVKAKLAADLKNEFDFTPKSRIINDLHHAKDAYLNIVCGNVYTERFAKKWFSIHDKYSLNPKTLFTHDVIHGEKIIWDSKNDLAFVRKTYEKNNIHLTRYVFCQKGGFFDQMPVKCGQGQAELKNGMKIEKYGGYNKVSSSFFVVAKYLRGGKREVSLVPVDLMKSEKFLQDQEYALAYTKAFLESINAKKIESVELPLERIVKIKSLLSLDGYKVWINGKANGGKIVLLSNAESLKLDDDCTRYSKKIENFSEKRKNNKNLKHDGAYDGLSSEKNIVLYDVLTQKLQAGIFALMPGNQLEVLESGRVKFESLEFEEQIKVLLNCINLFKTGRAGGCDLSLIGGKPSGGAMTLGAAISSGKFKEIKIVDVSPAGLHENTTMNLMEL